MSQDKVRAKKHLGQHFLNDQRAAERIVDAHLDKNPNLPILELGPGMGVLTKFLLQKPTPPIHVIELDEESSDYLDQNYPGLHGNIHRADFLKFDSVAAMGGDFTLIGNFPYNISTQILFKVLEMKEHVPLVTGMFQREVAWRVAEKPGTKEYGILSVLMQAWYNVEYLFTVNEGAFNPPPKVKSGVIRCIRKPESEYPDCKAEHLFTVVKTAFNQRRKMLGNSIKGLGINEKLSPELLMKRPEQLGLKEFVEIAKLLG